MNYIMIYTQIRVYIQYNIIFVKFNVVNTTQTSIIQEHTRCTCFACRKSQIELPSVTLVSIR